MLFRESPDHSGEKIPIPPYIQHCISHSQGSEHIRSLGMGISTGEEKHTHRELLGGRARSAAPPPDRHAAQSGCCFTVPIIRTSGMHVGRHFPPKGSDCTKLTPSSEGSRICQVGRACYIRTSTHNKTSDLPLQLICSPTTHLSTTCSLALSKLSRYSKALLPITDT